MDWSKWIAEQPEEVQDAYRKQVSKLESALESERDAAKEAGKKAKELEAKARDADTERERANGLQAQIDALTSKDTTTQTQLADAQKALEDARRELGAASLHRDFYRDATAHGVVNLDDAWLIAQGKGLIGGETQMDWDAFRKDRGYLFQTPGTSAANPPRGKTLTMEDVKRMTQAEYEQNRDAVNAVLAQSSKSGG